MQDLYVFKNPPKNPHSYLVVQTTALESSSPTNHSKIAFLVDMYPFSWSG